MDNDHDLIAGCLNKELAAQSTLYARFAPRMHAICQHFARDSAEADDILQSGFIRVYKNLHQYRFEGSFEGWIRKIMVNTAINFTKHPYLINNRVDIELMAAEPSACEDAVARLSVKDILSVVRNLPANHWTVFNLYEIEGYDHKEISSMLGIAEGTSKSHLHRAKASIRKKLRESGIG